MLIKICKEVPLAKDINLREIAEKAQSFTGADLKGLITSAQIKILDRYGKERTIYLIGIA